MIKCSLDTKSKSNQIKNLSICSTATKKRILTCRSYSRN